MGHQQLQDWNIARLQIPRQAGALTCDAIERYKWQPFVKMNWPLCDIKARPDGPSVIGCEELQVGTTVGKISRNDNNRNMPREEGGICVQTIGFTFSHSS